MILKPWYLPTLLLTLAACASVEIPSDYVNAELSGQIDGRDWAYKYAYIDPTVKTPNEDDVLFIFLPYVPKDKCPREQAEGSDRRLVMVAAPPGGSKQIKLKAGTKRNLVFQYDSKKGEQVAKSAKKGKFKLTQLGKDKVSGKIYAQLGDSNWVSGNFAAVVCNSLDLR